MAFFYSVAPTAGAQQSTVSALSPVYKSSYSRLYDDPFLFSDDDLLDGLVDPLDDDDLDWPYD